MFDIIFEVMTHIITTYIHTSIPIPIPIPIRPIGGDGPSEKSVGSPPRQDSPI